MTSLCPGPLFTTPGLNQFSTPSSRTSTPSDIDKRFTRVPFNSIPWPKQSPVSRVYDVRNSSTKMILLNNKYSKKSGQRADNHVYVKGCRLRGQTMNDGDIRAPDPSRHSGESPFVNRKSHGDCLTSTTPVFQPEVKTSLKWANTSQRPPLKFDDGSSVNYKRHTACMASDDIRLMNWQRPRRPYTTSIIRESQKCKNPLLDDLNPGERLYLYSIAKVYSVDSMRKLKQNQYCQLLLKEGQRGGYSAAEYRRYMRYLSSQRKTQQGPSDTYQRRRIRSAPSNRDTQTDNTESSPSGVTSSEQEQSRPASTKSKSRSTSHSMSRASLASKKTKKKTQETPTKSKSVTRSSTRANDGATPTDKKSSGTKPPKESKDKPTENGKISSDETQKNRSSPEKSKTNSPDRENSKMAETETADKKVTVVQVQVEEPDDEEAQVRGEEDKVKDSDDTEGRMASQHRGTSHKEGVDRPKSRLGERPRARDNSDDDYSADSDSDTSSSSSDESGADTSKSLSKSEPTETQTRSEPSKTSSSSQKAKSETPTKPEVVTSSPPRPETTKTEGSPPKDGDHDASYSEDFSEASKSASQSHASKSDDNKKQSDTSTSEKTSEKSQIKPGASLSEGKSSTDTSSSVKPTQQTKTPSDSPTNASEDSSTSASAPKVKVSQDDTKVKEESYSEDFTESTSKSHSGDKAKGEKSPEVKAEKSEVKFKEEVSVHNSSKDTQDTGDKSPHEGKPFQRERRDSIDMDREGRVKDWDKIEY